MELQLNLEKFEERQAIFVTELTKTIQVKLTEAGLESDKVKELTGALAFSITCMIDGISGIESNGVEVQPNVFHHPNPQHLLRSLLLIQFVPLTLMFTNL